MSIGTQIKKRRKELNLSQEDLANKIGVSRSAVSNWEIERNYPDLQLIVSLSEVLGVSLDDLLKENNDIVKKISDDTTKRISEKKWLIGLVALALSLLIILFFVLYNTRSLDVSNVDQIKSFTVSDGVINIELNLPKYRSGGDYLLSNSIDDPEELTLSLVTTRDLSFSNITEIQIPIGEFQNIKRISIIDNNKTVAEYEIR